MYLTWSVSGRSPVRSEVTAMAGKSRVFILLALIACARSEPAAVLKIALDTRWALTVRDGEDPCAALQRSCSAAGGEEQEECVAALHPLLTRQLTANWLQFSSRLTVQPSLFTLCKDIDFVDHERYAQQTNRTHVKGIINKLLTILQDGTGDAASREFDESRNEYRMTDEEQLELYLQAILLEPNHPLIVGQFGVTLLAAGREDLARLLFSDAVDRGLWPHPMQRPVSYYIPGLASRPWYDAESFAFPSVLAQGFEDIRDELVGATGMQLFGQEAENRNSYNFDGNWKTLVIRQRRQYTDIARRDFPKTIEWLEKCDEDFLLVKFSAVDPGTHIRPHTGPSNERLRTHFTLVHSGGARLRVADEWREWREGEVLIFDSSWEHEVIHEGTERRIVLIIDIWHPDYLSAY